MGTAARGREWGPEVPDQVTVPAGPGRVREPEAPDPAKAPGGPGQVRAPGVSGQARALVVWARAVWVPVVSAVAVRAADG